MRKSLRNIALSSSLALPSYAVAQTAPYIASIPENPIVYPGQSFNLNIVSDNHNLSEGTDGANIRLLNSPSFIYNDVFLPSVENDFFINQTDNFLNPPGTNSARISSILGTGPVDSNGLLASYSFTVPSGTPVGNYSFNFNSTQTYMTNSSGIKQQGVSIMSQPVFVTYMGDANLDGRVDVRDLVALANNWYTEGLDTNDSWFKADFNLDGKVNKTDLTYMAINWQAHQYGPQPIGGINIPEPSSLGLLGILSATAFLKRKRK